MNMIRKIIGLLTIVLIAGCWKVDTSKVVIPSSYTGPVIILYEQDEAIVNDGFLLLPPDGIIRVPYSDKFGAIDKVQFFIGSIDVQNKLDRFYDFDAIPSGRKVVFGGQTRVAISGVNGEGERVKYITYCVGNREEIVSCYSKLDSINLTH